MYQKEEIERLAKKYVETQEEEVFEALIKALESLINVQLGKNYSSVKPFWDDLRQEILLRVSKNRGGLLITQSKSLYQYLYSFIRYQLYRRVKELYYDSLNKNIIAFDDLGFKQKMKLGIEPSDESYD